MEKAIVEMNYTEKNGIRYPNIQISNNPEADQLLGRYGRMALEYLKENHPDQYTVLKLDGSLMEVMHKVQSEATEKIEAMTLQMLGRHPFPQTEDSLERTRHYNNLKLTADEIVLQEIVLVPR